MYDVIKWGGGIKILEKLRWGMTQKRLGNTGLLYHDVTAISICVVIKVFVGLRASPKCIHCVCKFFKFEK